MIIYNKYYRLENKFNYLSTCICGSMYHKYYCNKVNNRTKALTTLFGRCVKGSTEEYHTVAAKHWPSPLCHSSNARLPGPRRGWDPRNSWRVAAVDYGSRLGYTGWHGYLAQDGAHSGQHSSQLFFNSLIYFASAVSPLYISIEVHLHSKPIVNNDLYDKYKHFRHSFVRSPKAHRMHVIFVRSETFT